VVEEGRMTEEQQGVLNPLGVNCLRTFPGIGTVVFGARTLVTANTAFAQWRYVPVRRMALFIEQSLVGSLKWVVFEPNSDPLWTAIRTTIEKFMLGLFKQGAFAGTTPSESFQVKCDSSTTTQDDIDNGIVNIIVAFRPLKPAEFVIIKIAQLAGQAQA
jgi:phage tail sheath protein FI